VRKVTVYLRITTPLKPVTTLAVFCALTAGLASNCTAGAAPYAPIEEVNYGSGIQEPFGITINQTTGDLYVASFAQGTGVNTVNSQGGALSPPAPAFDAQEGAAELSGAAVDPANGNIYVVDAKNETIQTFDQAGHPLSGEVSVAGARTCAYPQFCSFKQAVMSQIATDSSGNIYFPNPPSHEVEEFSPTGSLIKTFTGSSVGAFGEPQDVAVDSEGDVYVDDTSNGRVVRIDQGTGAQSVLDSANAKTVAVDPATSNVFVGEYNEADPCEPLPSPCFHVVEYAPSGAKLEDFGAGLIGHPGEFLGPVAHTIAVDALTHNVYVGGLIFTQIPQVKPQTVTVEAASAVTATGATLNGEVNPNGDETKYHYEYIDEDDYVANVNAGRQNPYEVPVGIPPSVGGVVPIPDASAGEGRAEVPVSATISGLEGNTIYHFRIVTSDAADKVRESSDETFKTLQAPPGVSTGGLSNIAASSADVIGTVNPQRLETTYHYEYGTTPAYEESTPASGAGSGAMGTSAPGVLSDLAADTRYHYRLVAINEAGANYGEDETFTTAPGATPTSLTGGAGGVTTNTANISGVIETQGLPTNYGFQIGTEAETYGPASGYAYIGPGSSDVAVALALQNLQPSTTYHYRLVASNLYGTTTGADRTFTTADIPLPLIQPLTAPLIATPAIAFPSETEGKGLRNSKPVTETQELEKALEFCRELRRKARRAACEKRARRSYRTRAGN
jgi:hypothetical protein